MANNQIALLAQTPVFDTPFESQGKALQLRQLMNQGQVQDMDMQQRRQAIADDAGIRKVYSTVDDPNDRLNALYKINPKAAQALEKAQTDMGKDKSITNENAAKTQTENLKAINMRMQQARDLLGNVNDKQAAATWVQGMYADPDIGKFLTQHVGPVEQAMARIPDPQADPQGFGKWRMASQVSAEKLVEMTKPQVGARNLGNRSQTTMTDPITGKVTVTDTQAIGQSPDSAASNATSRANTRDSLAQSENHFQLTQGSPTFNADAGGFITKPTKSAPQGAITPLAGFPGKPLTEFQGKSAAFGDRAIKADTILTQLGSTYSPAAINAKNSIEGVPLIGGAMGAATNKFGLTSQDQQAEQAQRDFINALLRQESGAAIGQSEFENAKKQYFPQPGDKAEVLSQKAANRRTAIAGFVRSAGPSAGIVAAQPVASQAPSLPSGWSVEVH